METQDTFGANEWLVEEMYERYRQDPNSVDKAWWAVFAEREVAAANGGANNGGASNGAESAQTAPAAAALTGRRLSIAGSRGNPESRRPRTPEPTSAPVGTGSRKSVQTASKPPAQATSTRPTPADPLRNPDAIKPVSDSEPTQKPCAGRAPPTWTPA